MPLYYIETQFFSTVALQTALAMCRLLAIPSACILPHLDVLVQHILSVWIELESHGDVESFATASDMFTRFTTCRSDGDGDGFIEPSNATLASEEATGGCRNRLRCTECFIACEASPCPTRVARTDTVVTCPVSRHAAATQHNCVKQHCSERPLGDTSSTFLFVPLTSRCSMPAGETERKAALSDADAANALRIRDALRQALPAAEQLHGAEAFQAAMGRLHPSVRTQLEAALRQQ